MARPLKDDVSNVPTNIHNTGIAVAKKDVWAYPKRSFDPQRQFSTILVTKRDNEAMIFLVSVPWNMQ